MRRSAERASMAEPRASPHHRAAEAFVGRVRERFDDVVETVLLYGSVARGEQRGVGSDVDLLVVLRDGSAASEFEEAIRDLAYDVELEYGVVLSLIVLTNTEYERRAGRPFFEHVRRDAERLYG